MRQPSWPSTSARSSLGPRSHASRRSVARSAWRCPIDADRTKQGHGYYPALSRRRPDEVRSTCAYRELGRTPLHDGQAATWSQRHLPGALHGRSAIRPCFVVRGRRSGSWLHRGLRWHESRFANLVPVTSGPRRRVINPTADRVARKPGTSCGFIACYFNSYPRMVMLQESRTIRLHLHIDLAPEHHRLGLGRELMLTYLGAPAGRRCAWRARLRVSAQPRRTSSTTTAWASRPTRRAGPCTVVWPANHRLPTDLTESHVDSGAERTCEDEADLMSGRSSRSPLGACSVHASKPASPPVRRRRTCGRVFVS